MAIAKIEQGLVLDLDVYMAVVCVNLHCERGKELDAEWGQEFVRLFPCSKLLYITGELLEFWTTNVVTVPISPTEQSRVSMPFVFNMGSARHFLEQTDLSWYIRTTYDCFCYLPNFKKWMRKLNSMYNPRTDMVIRGQAIMAGINFLFVHGGAGWLMSRAAVERYVELEGPLTAAYQGKGYGDDVAYRDFLAMVNITPAQIDTTVFQGSPIRDSDYKALLQANMSMDAVTLPCSHPRALQHSIYKMNEMVFLHNGQPRNWVMEFGKQIIGTAPDNIFVEPQQVDSRICSNVYNWSYKRRWP
jgi:hypothetical protein